MLEIRLAEVFHRRQCTAKLAGGFRVTLSPLRYHRDPLRRFLLLSLPLLILAMALFHFALEALGKAPNPAAISAAGARVLQPWVPLVTWTLEALGLSSLFLLIYGRNSMRWLSGLLTGWIAWVFRGPLLVVSVVGIAGLPPAPWWSMVFSWWILYTLCGLLLAGAASASGYQP
jgi:hypothetical protein